MLKHVRRVEECVWVHRGCVWGVSEYVRVLTELARVNQNQPFWMVEFMYFGVLLILTLTVRLKFLNLKRLFWVVKFSLCARSMFVLCPFNPFLLPCCLFILCFVRCVLRAYSGYYEHIRWFTSIFGVYPLCVKTRQEGSGMCLDASGVHLGCF